MTGAMSTTRKGLHGEAECTFAMCSEGEGSVHMEKGSVEGSIGDDGKNGE